MRAALAPPAAALGSRARCSPPGAVSTGLRAPANWAMLWGWHGGPRGKDARAEGAEPPGVAREKERRGAGQGLPPRRAALRSGAPRSPAPPGALAPFTPRGDWSSGAWGAEVQRERLKEGRSCSTLDRGGHFPGSRTWLPRLLSTNQGSLLPASGCVPPARGNSGRCLFGSGNSILSRWLLRAREGG